MNIAVLVPLLRMLERSLIVTGGILSIYLGYKLFVMGIDKAQGSASALGIELKNFGPGLFFAALGAVVLVTTMRAAVRVGYDTNQATALGKSTNAQTEQIPGSKQAGPSSALFFGIEDPNRVANQWTGTAFFLETRQLLRRMDNGESWDDLKDLRTGLETKLESITMSADEYDRYQKLTEKLPLDEREQKELISLERKLFPL